VTGVVALALELEAARLVEGESIRPWGVRRDRHAIQAASPCSFDELQHDRARKTLSSMEPIDRHTEDPARAIAFRQKGPRRNYLPAHLYHDDLGASRPVTQPKVVRIRIRRSIELRSPAFSHPSENERPHYPLIAMLEVAEHPSIVADPGRRCVREPAILGTPVCRSLCQFRLTS
jgi:hypothetical protein